MSEEKEIETSLVEIIVQQVTRVGRAGTISELQHRINYLAHVKGNPTKSMSEAINHMYEEVDNLGGFVTDGVDEKNIDLVREVQAELVRRKVPGQGSETLFDLMLEKISQQYVSGQVMSNSGICIALAPDYRDFLVMAVPKRER